MNYAKTRDDEQLRILDGAIQEFFARRPAAGTRQTIIFFPGGLASRLKRARTPFKDINTPQTFEYDEIWLNLWTFVHPDLNALKLKMRKDQVDGAYHDSDERIIIADGFIELEGITPYDDFEDWCKDNNIDLFVFGWDWRRPLGETVAFFLNKFVPKFRQAFADRGIADPLENLTLMGHSFGGLIVKLILHADDPLPGKIKRAITVATPFYGHAGQIHKWFEGVDLLNHLDKAEIIKTLSSLPASYTLNWFGEETFKLNEAKLSADQRFRFGKYPSNDGPLRADPYNPQPSPSDPRLVRYPVNLGFSVDELKNGKKVAEMFAQELPANLARKFFTIRGVQLNLHGTVANGTIISTKWSFINPDFDPHSDSPIMDDEHGPGDEVLPAWSTHLVSLPESNRITVEGLLHHSFILSSPLMQKELATLLGVVPVGRSDALPLPLPVPASLNEALDFVKSLHSKLNLRLHPLRIGPDFLHLDRVLETSLGLLAGFRDLFSDEKRKGIARRIIMDLCR